MGVAVPIRERKKANAARVAVESMAPSEMLKKSPAQRKGLNWMTVTLKIAGYAQACAPIK
ncbi:MAG TPA: hypothetical protein VKT22_10785 [Steroidobacteraceae bacterium]|nr:hypothetical protein [Steroidobacteraceae bacterium]